MRVAVGLVPSLALTAATDICVVVDVLRATTTLTCLFEQGAAAVSIAPDIASARAAKRGDPDLLLVGEEAGLRPDGFDLGNSPSDIRAELVAGRRVVCCTSNGTMALRAVAGAPLVLLGCLRNATAVTAAAVVAARALGRGISIVCSGAGGGRAFALDDTLAAGYLAARVAAACREAGAEPPVFDDAALAATTLAERAVGDADIATGWARALRLTASGRHLEQLGLAPDVECAARIDESATVAEARPIGPDLVVVPYSAPAANRALRAGRATVAAAAEAAAGA